ncbi:cytochrome bd oxidase small subunit CydS [Paenibacillus sp. DMB20]
MNGLEDFDIFVAPMLAVAASIVFLVVYTMKYKDPSE